MDGWGGLSQMQPLHHQLWCCLKAFRNAALSLHQKGALNMHPYNLIHQNFATVNTLPLIDSWLVLDSCSIDELGQTRLEEAIRSEKQRLINYSIGDKLWMGFQSAWRWHRAPDMFEKRHGRTTSLRVGQEVQMTESGRERQRDGGQIHQKMKQHRGSRDLGFHVFTAGVTSVCRVLFKNMTMCWRKSK